MGDSNTIVVSTELGDVTVRKMPLADYAQLLKALNDMPKKLSDIVNETPDNDLKGMDNSDFLGMLPGILANSWGDIISVVAVPTDKDAEFMGKLDLADAVDVVGAILELNDIPRIIAAVKKIAALRAKLTRPEKQK